MDRRTFLKIAAAIAAYGGTSKLPSAFASNDSASDTVAFSPSVAKEIASIFATSMRPDNDLAVCEPTPIVDFEGDFYGYSVAFSSAGNPAGYVILDSRCKGLVSRYSLDNDAVEPYTQCIQTEAATAYSQIENSPILVASNPLEFGALNLSKDVMLTNSGKRIPALSNRNRLKQLRSKNPIQWQDVMIPIREVADETYQFLGGNFLHENTGTYRFVTEPEIEAHTGKYACVVTALYTVGSNILTGTWSFLINPSTDWAEYNKIWKYTETEVDHTQDGITYGSTRRDKMGSGFQKYMSSRGETITYEFISSNPSWTKYKIHVDKFKQSVFMAGINSKLDDGTVGRIGHAMAVAGYANLRRNGTNIPCLYIYDGWGTITYLNYSHKGFLDKAGTFFSK